MESEMKKYQTFAASQPPARKRSGVLQLAAGAIAITVLVAVVVGMRSRSSREELMQMSFPGIGSMVSNWITEWGRLSNVDNIDAVKLGDRAAAKAKIQDAAAAMKSVEEEKPPVIVSHLSKAAQLHRANGWMFDAPKSKGYLWSAPQRHSWMERAPARKGYLERAPSEKGWMERAPSEREPKETEAALKRHAEGWMFDTKKAKAPAVSEATLRKQAQGWMFDLPSHVKTTEERHAPYAATAPTATKSKAVGTQWKKWAEHKASSLNEKVHRIAVGPGGWEVYIDAKTDRPFYYNREQDASSWTSPWSAAETKKNLRSASASLEHLPVSGMDAIEELKPEKIKAKGRVFDVNAQESDMNHYFDSLGQNIDRGIDLRNNKLIEARGFDQWHPERAENLASARMAQHQHQLEAAHKPAAFYPPPRAAAQHAQQPKQQPLAKAVKTAPALPAAVQVASGKGMQAEVVDGSDGGWGRDTAAVTRRRQQVKERARRGRGAAREDREKNMIFTHAWDTMEGGEGPDMMARDHV